MIRLKIVDETNFDAVVDLSVSEKDERRVATNVYSLAQAWLYRDQKGLEPYAVVSADRVVGFLLLHKNMEKKEYLIWRLMIDQKEQNKGYGKEVLRMVIKQAKEDRHCHTLLVDYVIGNHRMRGMLESLGFKMQGLQTNEVVMALNVNEYKGEII